MIDAQHVVIDTSTLVSALISPAGQSRQAFLTAARMYKLCMSRATLNELQDVLERSKFDAYVPFQERMEFVALITERSPLWDIDPMSENAATGACRDTRDEKFLSLAFACYADALITSDADLLVHNPWRGTPIMTPAAFVTWVQSRQI